MGRPRTLDYNKIKEMHEQDFDSVEIAKVVGTDSRSVRDAINRMELPKRSGYPRDKYDHKAIIEAYQSPMSADQVAEKIGCCKAEVFHVLKLHRMATREGYKRHDTANQLGFEPTKKYFVDLMDRHSGNASLAAVEVKLPYHTLIDWLVRYNIPRRGSSNRHPDFPVDKAVSLSNAGNTYAQIADRLDVPYSVVRNNMHRAKHKAPPRGRCAPFTSASAQRVRFISGVKDRHCVVCGEDRSTDYAHIKPKKKLGPSEPENCMMICATHHKLYDKAPHLLTAEEVEKLIPHIQVAVKRYGWWEGCLIPNPSSN